MHIVELKSALHKGQRFGSQRLCECQQGSRHGFCQNLCILYMYYRLAAKEPEFTR